MKKRITIIASILIFIALIFSAQRLLMPKYMSGVYEGRLIGEYYREDKSHDVIFIGDCELYENVSPVALWEEYGIPSYIRGSAQQLIWQSYYLLEETLKYEKPEVVVFSVLAMKYDQPQNEAYNRLTLDGMRLSTTKARAVFASMTPEETWISYLFPILRYHERWKELTADDTRYFTGGKAVSHNGFMMRCDTRPVTVIPQGPKLPDYQFGENSYVYLDKMTKLCADNGIKLLLVKAPSIYPHWYDQWDEQMTDYAARNGIEYVNLLELSDEIGIDFSTDTYDGGLHLNLSGAEKVSSYLGAFLRETYDLADRRSDAELSELWASKKASYDAQRDAQLAEIEAFDKVLTFFVE